MSSDQIINSLNNQLIATRQTLEIEKNYMNKIITDQSNQLLDIEEAITNDCRSTVDLIIHIRSILDRDKLDFLDDSKL